MQVSPFPPPGNVIPTAPADGAGCWAVVLDATADPSKREDAASRDVVGEGSSSSLRVSRPGGTSNTERTTLPPAMSPSRDDLVPCLAVDLLEALSLEACLMNGARKTSIAEGGKEASVTMCPAAAMPARDLVCRQVLLALRPSGASGAIILRHTWYRGTVLTFSLGACVHRGSGIGGIFTRPSLFN